jgi:PAS domain S-box-containing protein
VVTFRRLPHDFARIARPSERSHSDLVTHHDEVTAQLHLEQDRLAATISSLFNPYVILRAVRDDPGRIVDFEYTDANDDAISYNLSTRDALIGSSLLERLPAHVESGLFDQYVHTIETGEPLVLEDYVFANAIVGSDRRYDMRAVRVRDSLGRTWRDVTEERAMLDQYRLLAENAADVVFEVSADFVVKWVSPSVGRLTGHAQSDVVGLSMVDLIHPDDFATLTDVIAWAGPTERNVAEVRVRKASGDYLRISIWGREIKDADGTIVGYIGSARDAEDEYEIRRALLDSEERYRLLAENGSDVIFQTDDEGWITWISPSVQLCLGWPPDDLVGVEAAQLIHEDDLAKAKALLATVRSGQRIDAHELRFRSSSGEAVWMTVLAQPIPDQAGVVTSIVISLRNCQAEVLARRALLTLSAGSRELVRAENETELLHQMCEVAAGDGGYSFAWYGRKNLDEQRTVTQVAMSAGKSDYLEGVVCGWGDGLLGQGPMGRAMRLGTPVIVKDLRTDADFTPWLESALPVRVGEVVDGALMVYAPECDGFTGFAVSILEDLTAELGYGLKRLRDHELLVKSQSDQALLTNAIEQSGEAIVVSSPSNVIVYANPATSRISGYSHEELIGASPDIFKSGLQSAEFNDEVWARLHGGQSWSGIYVNRHKSGDLYEEDTTISPIHDAQGNLTAYVAVKHDLTVERRLEGLEADMTREQLDREAFVGIMRSIRPADNLRATAQMFCEAATHLPNTSAACVLLREDDGRLQPVAASGTRVFEVFNGESFLPENPSRFADLLHGPIQLNMDPATWSTNPGLLRVAINEGLKGIVLAPIRWEGRLTGILALGTRDEESARVASTRFTYFEELGSFAGSLFGAQTAVHRHRNELRARIRDVIDQCQFHPVFQPFVDLTSGDTVGYEALTRFDDGVRPDLHFIEAHTVGLGTELESVCAEAALEASRDLAANMFLSVNFSPAALIDGHAAATLRGCKRGTVIEVTEHVIIDNYAAVRKAVDEIEGCRLAVDDAGAGFASLKHILELRPDIVKLDMSVVRDIDTNPARQAMAAGMCHFAEQSGTIIIAEGIETEAEAECLRNLGVPLGRGGILGQGFHFARPSALPWGGAGAWTPPNRGGGGSAQVGEHVADPGEGHWRQ